jgi:hypothetical protein
MPTTSVRGKTVTLPDTLDEIRANLPEERRAEFDRVIGSTPLRQIVQVAIMEFALPDEAQADDAAAGDRIRAGDWTGVVDSDGNPYTP